MNISQEKLTFLTANYGLSPEQIEAFHDAYHCAFYQIAPEVEMSWHEGGYIPDNEESAMIEVVCDADRLEPYMDDYMDWCFDFMYKQELAHELLGVPMPEYLKDFLQSRGLSCFQAVA